MPLAVAAAFKSWLKASTNMKLSSDSAVTRLTYEGITNFPSLTDFDKKAIQALPSTCKNRIPAIAEDSAAGIPAEPEVLGANISSISVQRLIVAVHASKYYSSINRAMSVSNMHYGNILAEFKIEWDAYLDLKEQDAPKPPTINDRDNDRTVIKWAPIFVDCLSRTYGSMGPLSYVLRENETVEDEVADPLGVEESTGITNSYFGKSGCLHAELTERLPHSGPIYKHDNSTVFSMIERASRNTSVESTVKSFSRKKDGRGAYLAIIKNHAGETKYRAISKKRLNLLQHIKWNGRSYPLETHVSNHRQAVDDIEECSAHITVSVPDKAQRVEYLIDSINCSDSTLQAALGLIRANTNGMRKDFELAASYLIEVDPFKRSHKAPQGQIKGGANVSAIDFSAGRGGSGVDLRWHHPKEFKALPEDQKDELVKWQKTQEGKKLLEKSREAAASKKRKAEGGVKTRDKSKSNDNGNWKMKLKRAVRTEKGLKTIMSVLGAEGTRNQDALRTICTATRIPEANLPRAAAVVADTNVVPTIPKTITYPVTNLKLNAIVGKTNKE